MARNGNGNKSDVSEEQKRLAEEAKKEQEKQQKAKQRKLDSLPAYYTAMYDREGTALLEMGNITDRQKVLYAVQIMQESIPLKNRKRLSTILREAELHGSIAVDGAGQKNVLKLYEGEIKVKTGAGSEAIDRGI